MMVFLIFPSLELPVNCFPQDYLVSISVHQINCKFYDKLKNIDSNIISNEFLNKKIGYRLLVLPQTSFLQLFLFPLL